jgi:hypothetical protein
MFDYLAIFKKLNERKIKYIVVGGIAVNLHGIPRMTYDIDLILGHFSQFVIARGHHPRGNLRS